MSDLPKELVDLLEGLAEEIRDSKWTEQASQDIYKDAKTQLWSIIDQHVENSGLLAHTDFWLKGATEEQALEHAGLMYPEWEVQEVTVNEDGATVFLRECPQYKGFEYYSEEHDVKIGRSVSEGKETFDLDRFIAEQPELADQTVTATRMIVARPGKEAVTTDTFSLDQDAVEELLAKDGSLKDTFAQYVLPGVPQTKMLPVARKKKVKS